MDKKNPSKRLHDLELIKQISKGHFGVLYKARTTDGEIVALKAVKNVDKHAVENSKKEMYVYQNLSLHPNILKCYGHAETSDSMFIMFEYIQNKDLWEYFFKDRQRRLSPRQIAKYIWQLCDALRLLHHNDIIHADVKLENILVDDDDDIRLCDFGLAQIDNNKYKSDYRRGVCGTVGYIAPEVYEDEIVGVTPAIDAWAVGIVLYELLYRKSPFIDPNKLSDYKTSTGSLDKDSLKAVMCKFPSLPRNIDEDLLDLFRRVFKLDPDHRATISEIQRHRWITKNYKPKR